MQCIPATQARRRRRRFPERELLERIRRYEDLLRQGNIKFEPMHKDASSEAWAAQAKDSPEDGSYESDDGQTAQSGPSPAPSSAGPSRAGNETKYETFSPSRFKPDLLPTPAISVKI